MVSEVEESVKAINQQIRTKLRVGDLDEVEFVNNNLTIQKHVTQLDTLILQEDGATESSQTHISKLFRLKILLEETRLISDLKQEINVKGSSDHDHETDSNKSKWLKAGLCMLSLYRDLSSAKLLDSSKLQYETIIRAMSFILISPVMDIRKSKLLFHLAVVGQYIKQNSLQEFRSSRFLLDIFENIHSAKVLDYVQFQELFNWLNCNIYQENGPFEFLSVIPQNVIEKNLFQSVLEYNLIVLSCLYSAITFDNLITNNLGLKRVFPGQKALAPNEVSEIRVLALVSNMINSGRLHAKIDQANDILVFDEAEISGHDKNSVINGWQKWYMKEFLTNLNSIAEDLQGS